MLEIKIFAAVWSQTGGHLIWVGNYTMDILDPFSATGAHRTMSKVRGSWVSIGSFKQQTFTGQLSPQAAKSSLRKSMRFVVSGYLEVDRSRLFVFGPRALYTPTSTLPLSHVARSPRWALCELTLWPRTEH